MWTKLVQFGFRLLYHEMAWTYDLVSWAVSLGQWRVWQLTALDFVAGDRVLEVAHGPGHMLVELRQRGFEVVGVDFSPQMGRLAGARLARAGLTVPLVHGRVQDLPFAAEQFDTVLSQFPTSFILEPAALASMARMLKPHGRVIILPEGHLTGGGAVRRFLDWLFRITGQRPGPEVDLEEVWAGFTAVLAQAGFTADIHTIPLSGSIATVIVAKRVS